jgi:hypothetical protein
MMEPLSFLQSVKGYVGTDKTPESANKPVKLAVIDPAYSGGLPKVRFEGESTVSAKGYPFLNSYLPVASDRVVLMPAGTTYVIVGKIDDTVNNLVSRVAALEATPATPNVPHSQSFNGGASSQTIASGTGATAYANVTGLALATFDKRLASTAIVVDLGVGFFATVASSEVRFGVSVDGAAAVDIVNFFINPANTHLYASGSVRITGLAAGTRSFQIQWRRVSATTATVITRNGSDWGSLKVTEEPA